MTGLPVLGIIVAAFAIVLLFASLKAPKVALLCVLTPFLLTVTPLNGSVSHAIDLRVLAVPFALLLVWHATLVNRYRYISDNARRTLRLLKVLALAIALSALFSFTTKADIPHAVGAVVAVLVCVLTIWSSVVLFSEADLRGLLWAMIVLVIVSSLVLSPSALGHTGLRVSGIFGNPNALGLTMALALPIIWVKRRWRTTLLLACLALLVLSASRSAVGAAFVEVLSLILSTRWRAMRAPLVALALVGLLVFAFSRGLATSTSSPTGGGSSVAGLLLNRPYDRLAEWTTGAHIISSHPLTGIGPRADRTQISSSYLLALEELGLMGGVILVWATRRFIVALRRGTEVAVAVVLVTVIDGAFESWVFVGGSFFFLFAWLLIVSECSKISRVSPAQINGNTPLVMPPNEDGGSFARSCPSRNISGPR